MSKEVETNVVKPDTKFLHNEVEHTTIDLKWEESLDAKIKELEDFMSNNSGKGKKEEEKDNLYGDAKTLWKEYTALLQEANFNFHLNRDQYNFLTDLLLSKMEYDVNTVFLAIELTTLLKEMKSADFKDDEDLVNFHVDATQITYIYHLISSHKVKGLSKKSYLFAEVLKRIGDISKIFNYYETANKNLSKDIQDWVLTFEDGVSKDSIKGAKLESK